MQCEAKADRTAECFRIGREIYQVERELVSLQREVGQLEGSLRDINARIFEVEQNIANIQFAEDAARSFGSRGGIVGGLAGEATAQAIRRAMQKDRLERQKLSLEAQRSRIRSPLEARRRRLDEVAYLLSSLEDGFRSLNCPLGARQF